MVNQKSTGLVSLPYYENGELHCILCLTHAVPKPGQTSGNRKSSPKVGGWINKPEGSMRERIERPQGMA